MKKIVIAITALLAGCVVEQPSRVVYVPSPPPPPPAAYQPPPPVVYQAPAPEPVVSVYVEPPLYQPPPIRVEWAPPPMLVETVAPMPYEGAVWTGGYWVWEGNWVWAHGRWAPPPQPGYGWVNPYYENRGGSVIFVNGFWAAPGVSFVAPSMSVNIALGVVGIGVVAGLRPIGPQGVFVPAPPGSHYGLIVPAPIGTAPAVVTGAPPIVREGMHINVNSVSNTHNVTNITNVTIVAPANATANGQAVNTSVPAQPHLAAAMPPVVKAFAPEPASSKPIPAYVPGHQPAVLPPPQMVHAQATPALTQPHAAEQARPGAPAVPAAPSAPPVRAASQFNEAPARPAAMPQVNQGQPMPAATPLREQQDRMNRPQPPATQQPPQAQKQSQPQVPQQAQQQWQKPQPPAKNPPANQAQPQAAKPPQPKQNAQKPQPEKKQKEEGKPGEKHEKE